MASCGTAPASMPNWDERPITRASFVRLVYERGADLYRDLPWRNIDDAYGVLVSEVMLQQTQVTRVEKYWSRWMELFPTVDSLAAADTALVLDKWQGLGYNRRALALKRACETCARDFGGVLPHSYDGLVALPGIGPATAAGIISFAYDEPAVYIETNVRSVFLHELFPDTEGVSDKELRPYVQDSCPKQDVRRWYYALLDYGAHLKKQTANPSRRSKHYARQSAFEGSRREKRSFILKQVLAAPEGTNVDEVRHALDSFERQAGRSPIDDALFTAIVDELATEGFFTNKSGILMCN